MYFNNQLPGTIKVNGYYVDRTEISNIAWMEYMFHRKFSIPESKYHRLIPDLANTWYYLPEYRYYPIVLITYDQTVDFCKWRSEVVSWKLKW